MRLRGGSHLVSDTGLAIVCCDLSQFFLKLRQEGKGGKPSRNCIWKGLHELLISQYALEQIWEELCNVVDSL